MLSLSTKIIEEVKNTFDTLYSSVLSPLFIVILVALFGFAYLAVILVDSYLTYQSIGYIKDVSFVYRISITAAFILSFNILPFVVNYFRKKGAISLCYALFLFYCCVFTFNLGSNVLGFGGDTLISEGCHKAFDENTINVSDYCIESRKRYESLRDSVKFLQSYENHFNKGKGKFFNTLSEINEMLKADELSCEIDRSWPDLIISEPRASCYALGTDNFWNRHIINTGSLVDKIKNYDTESICKRLVVLYSDRMNNKEISSRIPDFCLNENKIKNPAIKKDIEEISSLMNFNFDFFITILFGFIIASVILLLEKIMNDVSIEFWSRRKKEYSSIENKIKRMFSSGLFSKKDAADFHRTFSKREILLTDLKNKNEAIYDIMDIFIGSGNSIYTRNYVPRSIMSFVNREKRYIWKDQHKKIFLLETLVSIINSTTKNTLNCNSDTKKNKYIIITDGSSHDFVKAKGNRIIESREVKITPLFNVYKKNRKTLPDSYQCKKQISEVRSAFETENPDNTHFMMGGMTGKIGFSWFLAKQNFTKEFKNLCYVSRHTNEQFEISLKTKRTFTGNDLSEHKELYLLKNKKGIVIGLYIHSGQSKKEFKNNLLDYAKKHSCRLDFFSKTLSENDMPEIMEIISDRTINTINSIYNSAKGADVYIALMTYWPVAYLISSRLENNKIKFLQWDDESHKLMSL